MCHKLVRPWRAGSHPPSPQHAATVRGDLTPGPAASGPRVCTDPPSPGSIFLLPCLPPALLCSSFPRLSFPSWGAGLTPVPATVPGLPAPRCSLPLQARDTKPRLPSSFLPKPGSRRGSENSSESSALRRGPYRRAKVRLPSRPPCHGCSPRGPAPPGSPWPARAVGPQIPPQRGVRLGSLKSGRRAAPSHIQLNAPRALPSSE